MLLNTLIFAIIYVRSKSERMKDLSLLFVATIVADVVLSATVCSILFKILDIK